MAPASCTLDQSGLSAQHRRYRAVGDGARVLERTPRRLVIRPGTGADDELIAELIDVERECCPFFSLTWSASRRLLEISVPTAEHEPALDAIAYALGFDG